MAIRLIRCTHTYMRMPNDCVPHAMQARLHAARAVLSRRARSAAVHVQDGIHGGAEPTVQPSLYPLVACMAMCLSCLEELSLDLGGVWYDEQEAYPSILAPLACVPHLARLSVSYPSRAGIDSVQAGPGRSTCCVEA